MIDKAQMDALLKETLANSPADETELVAHCGTNRLTRYTGSVIHQNVSDEDCTVTVRVAVGKRIGVASTNRLKADVLAEAVRQATEVAQAGPEDPDFPGFPGSERAPEADTYSEATALMAPSARAEAVVPSSRISGISQGYRGSS